MNPYWSKSLFEFFPLFFSRMGKLLTGQLPLEQLASDEVQVLVLAAVAIASTLVGTLLLLKRMTMLANSLSHTILIGIVIAYLIFAKGGGELGIDFRILFFAAVLAGVLTTLFTQLLHQKVHLQEDASIGIVFTTLFALGILLVTLYTRNTHIGLEVVMGNVDALHFEDLKLASRIALANAFLVALFFKEWKLICFDSGLASSLGFRPTLFNYVLMLMTSCTAIASFRAVGVLLFLAFLVGLPLTARLITNRISLLLAFGCGLGVLLALVSVATARHILTVHRIPLSTAGISATLIGVAFALTLAARRLTFSQNPR